MIQLKNKPQTGAIEAYISST